jgi:hypothetical protein
MQKYNYFLTGALVTIFKIPERVLPFNIRLPELAFIFLILRFKNYFLHFYPKVLFVSLTMILISLSVLAQQEDSGLAIPKARPMMGTFHNIEQGMRGFRQIDTGMHQVQKFDTGYLQNLATPGSPVFDLIWNPFKTTGFDPGFHQWDAYRLTAENVKFYNTQNPYADLFYVQGASDIQAFRAVYAQNIKPYWNFSLLIDGLSTNKGYYDPQGTQTTKEAVNTWYQSPNGRYMGIFSAVFNSFQNQENGGIASDSIFKNASAGNRTQIPLNFTTITGIDSSKQYFNESFVTARQYYRFGPVENIKVHDTDSVATRIVHPEYFISHTFEYHYTKYNYKDMDLGILKPFYLAHQDPNLTNDIFQSDEFSNKIALGRSELSKPVHIKKKIDSSALKRHPLYYQVYAKYSIIKASQVSGIFNDTRHYDNTSIGFEINKNGNKTDFSASGEYFLEGYNKNDYNFDARYQLPLLKRFLPEINFEVRAQQATPSYTDQVFLGNHFLWFNRFVPTQSAEAGAYVSDSTGFRLGGYLKNARNLVYYDTAGLPRQYGSTLNYLQLFVSKDFKIGPVHLLNSINYQKSLSGSYPVRVPTWLIRTSWYFEHYLFAKKAMLFQGGFDFSYCTAYKGYGWMPEISRFYVQDNVNIGNYQVWDLWVAGKVKRFTFFGKLEHLNQGLSGNWYFIAPHYPLYPLSYRFGIRWVFYN